MTSLTDYYAEQGKDLEEAVKAIARERELLKELGIEIRFDNYIVNDEENENKPKGNNQTVSEKERLAV